MTGPQSQLLSEAREFATDIFLNKVNKSARYHSLEHTERVVLACEEMAEYYSLQPEDRLTLLVAAWLHDTGFSGGSSEGHEEVSKRIATTFLQEHNAEPSVTEKVISCIGATRMPQSPASLIEQILCDADLFHLGTDEFKLRNEELKQELSELSKENVSKKKWRKITIAFLENHKYFTDYGKRNLQPVKEKHIEALRQHADNDFKKKGKKDKKEDELLLNTFQEELKKDSETKKKKEEKNQTERGISTVFRIMASNHANLSQMADSKANIMISVNSIILSVVVSVLVRHLDENKNLIVPTITLVLVCVATIIYSVLATRPNISRGTFTREDIQAKKTNLLFFGNFHSMNLPDYDWAMKEMLNDKDYLYSSMVKDLYFLGVVLAKKYRLLRISYNIFMYGLIVSMLLYAIMISYEAFFVETAVETTPFIK